MDEEAALFINTGLRLWLEASEESDMYPSEMTDQELTQAVIREVMGIELKQSTWWIDGTNPTAFSPLTNANHWWMVVERMSSLGYFCTISRGVMGWPQRLTNQVKFELLDQINPKTAQPASWFSRNDDIGRAILEAALATVRGKEGR